MVDIRVQRLAKLLAHYSLDLRKGDRLAIQTQPLGVASRAGTYARGAPSRGAPRILYRATGSGGNHVPGSV